MYDIVCVYVYAWLVCRRIKVETFHVRLERIGIVYAEVLYTVAMWCTLYLPFENRGINTPIVEHNKRHALRNN